MQYEYRIYDQKDGINPDHEHELNWLGKQGWELVAIRKSDHYGHRFYFKRLVDEPKEDDE
jgi:hypothetical protein